MRECKHLLVPSRPSAWFRGEDSFRRRQRHAGRSADPQPLRIPSRYRVAASDVSPAAPCAPSVVASARRARLILVEDNDGVRLATQLLPSVLRTNKTPVAAWRFLSKPVDTGALMEAIAELSSTPVKVSALS